MVEDFLIVNDLLQKVTGFGVIGLLLLVGGYLRKIFKELKTRNQQLDDLTTSQADITGRLGVLETQGNKRQAASLASLHDRIYANYEIILKRGTVTMKELNNLVYLWEAYSNLGGNGTGQKMYERICELPIIEDEGEDK